MTEIAFPTNFGFMKEHNPVFLELASNAERVFSSDPNTTLIKLRQLGEALAQDLASRCDISFDERTTQADLLGLLQRKLYLDKNIKDIFHRLRTEGNKASHTFETSHREAMDSLKLSRSLCVWYHQTFGKQGVNFKPKAFVAPSDPSHQLQELHQQIRQLSSQLNTATVEISAKEKLALLKEQEREEYQQLAEMMDEETRQLSEQNKRQEVELTAEIQNFKAHIKQLQTQITNNELNNHQQPIKVKLRAFIPSEEDARILIDEQLRQAGWMVDSQIMTQARGELPEIGKNKAIAEWTMSNGRADYIFFAGLTPIAAVEAKRQNANVASKLQQAERYAQGIKMTDSIQSAWQLVSKASAWQVDNTSYDIPFVFSCNGRPYIKQLAEQSGIWFRDVRKGSNIAKALQQFHSPEGLLDLLKRDIKEAQNKLQQEPFAYLGLRDFQVEAIQAVESKLEQGQRSCLLAMATGTGKTRTIIGLIYRFLKTERFKRILFLVDRTALGVQAFDSMQEMTLEQNQTLSKIYNVAELGDMAIEAETRVHVTTVQAMVQRIFNSDAPPNIDQYDCIIVDEAHRGYTLDQEMTAGELSVRDASQYLSSYRRALDYFDAVKIGLTATPAKHTSEIFGKPVYNYSYREAVAADWLIDYEPPIRYETLLTQNGIHLEKGEKVARINTMTGNIDTAELEDELDFDVTSFNRTIITEGFNRVICQQLAQEIDPNGKDKTLIFCATDLHADMVKRLLDEAFAELYEDEYNEAAVKKITGASDKVNQLIRQYKNEKYPSIAITVDLLTTGINVPSISHLVFLRRVKSRILFEQMIGRATRRCDDIGKTVFKVYDPVDLFASLEDVNTMKPLVKKPNITIKQLIDELIISDSNVSDKTKEAIEQTASNEANYTQHQVSEKERMPYATTTDMQQHNEQVLDELSQKLMRVLRKADSRAERNPELKAKLNELEELWGVPPARLHQVLHEGGIAHAKAFLIKHNNLLNQLTEVKYLTGSEHMPVIYDGEDELVSREQSFGEHQRPADYLDSFDTFIKTNLNKSVALTVIATKPKDLTRDELRKVKMLLDSEGYTEAKLQSAWRNNTNQDIAASIVGHIRRAAIGEPLISFEQRVNQAMERIYSSQAWTPIQRKWLDRLAKQLKHETVVDKQFVNQRFADNGGSKQFDKVLQNKLDNVLEQLSEALWLA